MWTSTKAGSAREMNNPIHWRLAMKALLRLADDTSRTDQVFGRDVLRTDDVKSRHQQASAGVRLRSARRRESV
jgi:hypothetical protein